MSLVAASLMIPSGRGFADENPPGNHKQREELRRDQQQLERLRQQRDHELREGDKREAREYNDKIRDQKRESRQDRRTIYGQDRDRRHHDRDHDHDLISNLVRGVIETFQKERSIEERKVTYELS